MAIRVGKNEVERLKKRAEGFSARLRSVKEKAEESAGHLVQTVTITATSFAFGLANGRFVDAQGRRGVELFGVPLELLSGIGIHLLGFMGSSKYSEHLHNIGDGAVAAYTTILGVSVGDRMRQNQASPNGANAETSGPRRRPQQMGPGQRSQFNRLSDEEIMRIAASRRRA